MDGCVEVDAKQKRQSYRFGSTLKGSFFALKLLKKEFVSGCR